MAYIPTVWQCGDVVSAEKLNKLENGLADCCGGGTEPLLVHKVKHEDDPGATFLDKTFGEIRQASEAGRMVVLITDNSSDTEISATLSNLSYVEYYVGEGSAYGSVSLGNSSYSCETSGAPYTLEALDATYPYMSS